MNSLGLWQNWGMFISPGPQYNIAIKYRIVYSDGSYKDSYLPRMRDMGVFERYVRYHWSKITYNAYSDTNYYYLNDVARYIARQCNKNPRIPPFRIDFYHVWSMTPPPEKGLAGPVVIKDQEQFFHGWLVTPVDLR
jgi:hypothetical protein